MTERIWASGDRSSRGNAAVDADRLVGQPRGGRARRNSILAASLAAFENSLALKGSSMMRS